MIVLVEINFFIMSIISSIDVDADSRGRNWVGVFPSLF